MEPIEQQLIQLDWTAIAEKMHQNGYAILRNMFSDAQCEGLKQGFDDPSIFRKTVVMERYQYGLGAYRYYDYPLPALVESMRSSFYPYLVPIANQWMKALISRPAIQHS
jgi:hypothetical protein